MSHDLHQLVLQLGAGQRIERAEGLVHQQHLGFHRQRPGDADALLHAAGDFVRVLVRGMRQADQFDGRLGAGLELGLAFLGCRKRARRPGRCSRSRSARAAGCGSGRPPHAPGRGRRFRGRRSSSTPVVGLVRPAIRLSSVDLPQPEWPISAMNSPWAMLQVDVAQGDELAFLGVEGLADTLDLDEFFHDEAPLRRFFGAVSWPAGSAPVRGSGRRCR